MLLRRVTEHVKQQNWFAVGVDFIIVVVGVFVGLQAQEWNNHRADRQSERVALERLIIEFEHNLDILAADKEKAQRALGGTERLLRMIALQSFPEEMNETLANTILDTLQNAVFVPALGTTNSLIASGDMRLIGDPEIQRVLTQWPSTAQALIEWQEIERMHGEELILGETFDYISWPTIILLVEGGGLEPSALGDNLAGLFASRRLEGMLVNRRHNTNTAIRRIGDLEESTRELIERFETRLAEISRD